MLTFYETFEPRVQYTLEKFTAQEDTKSENVSFLDLEANFKDPLSETDVITYSCNMCDVHFPGFKGKAQLNKHFEDKHQAEQVLLCCMCNKDFDFNYLAGNRWGHQCSVHKFNTT